jgi:hypothetical protein
MNIRKISGLPLAAARQAKSACVWRYLSGQPSQGARWQTQDNAPCNAAWQSPAQALFLAVGFSGYLDFVRNPLNGFLSRSMPYRGGVELSIRV